MQMKLKKLNLSLAFSFLFSVNNASASISSEMDQAFGAMTNLSAPSSYKDARKGVFTGGQAVVRIPNKNIQPLAIQAPYFDIGCGGIDMHGGSFSYIDVQEYLDMFKKVGSQAVGYGIKLALTNFCDSCESVMSGLEDAARAINSININSCQLAQGIFEKDARDGIVNQFKTAGKTIASAYQGVVDDWNGANKIRDDEDKSAAAMAKENAEANGEDFEQERNLTWDAVSSTNFKTGYGNNDEHLQMMMTMIGFAVQRIDPSTKEPTNEQWSGGKISIKDLIEGSGVQTLDPNQQLTPAPILYYRCRNDDCLEVEKTGAFVDEGLKNRVLSAYLGSDGWIQSMRTNSDWSAKAKEIVSFPTMIGSICNKKIYSIMSTDKTQHILASSIASTCASRIALEFAKNMVDSYIKDAEFIINTSKDNADPMYKTAKEISLNLLKESRAKYNLQYDELDKKLPITGLLQYLDALDVSKGKVKTFIE